MTKVTLSYGMRAEEGQNEGKNEGKKSDDCYITEKKRILLKS